jgi:hypothetical protein
MRPRALIMGAGYSLMFSKLERTMKQPYDVHGCGYLFGDGYGPAFAELTPFLSWAATRSRLNISHARENHRNRVSHLSTG